MASPRLPFERKTYTPILPAIEQTGRGRAGDEESQVQPGGGLFPKRQKRTGRFACDACRSRKSACDGLKPTCSQCTRRGTACVYSSRTDMNTVERAELEQLRRRHESPGRGQSGSGGGDEDLLHRLKSLPEDEAMALLLQVRSESRVNQDLVTARDIAPPLRASVEFELMHRHPILYPTIARLDAPAIKVSQLRLMPYRERESETAAGHSNISPEQPSSRRPSPTKRGPQQRPSPDPSRLPGDHFHLCDPRLDHIKILKWTQVPISNELGARIISFYLTVDHPILGLFDADLFLGDLVAERTEFCCPLLLSAVLGFACQGYSNIDPDTAALSYAFFNEAQQLHREESTGNPQYQFAIPNIAATQLLSLTATCNGRNELALSYMMEGIELAHQNGLLAVGEGQSARNWLDDHIDYVKAASHTAWGTFCRATLLGMNYQNTYVRIPSWLPIPGTAIVRSGGESAPFELPAYMGQSFTQLCGLAPIINEMLHEYYDNGDGIAPTKRASFNFAQELYSRLLGWANGLPMSMARGYDMPHHAAIVHIIFHTAVLDLFRPFPYQQPQKSFSLDSFLADDATPEGISKASVNQLKHLILVFRTQYPCAVFTMLWQNALLYIANACLPLQRRPSGTDSGGYVDGVGSEPMEDVVMTAEEPEESEEVADRRKWFMVCIDGLLALAPQFGIAAGIVQAILSMAILKGSIPAVEGRAIMDQLKADTEVSSRHRRAAIMQREVPTVDGSDGDEYDETGVVRGGGRVGVVAREREGSEVMARIEYSSGRVQGGDRAGLTVNGLVNLPGAQRGGNSFVIDLNEASVNPSAASLDVLARAFDELAMFDEFTTGQE